MSLSQLLFVFLLCSSHVVLRTSSAAICGDSCCPAHNEAELLSAVADRNCLNIYVYDEISVSNTVTVSRSLTLRGDSASASIVQTHPGRDALVIRDVTTGVTISDLIVDARGAQAALVVANASNVAVTRTQIFGSSAIFAVFFAGHDVTAGQASLDNFASRIEMDTNNSIADSVVSSPWTGDSLSFSLQYLGTVRNNTVIDGGKIAYYMNANGSCVDNTVLNSISQGIYISSPSFGNLIMNNSLLNTTYAGIKSQRQYEHEPDGVVFDMSSSADIIQGNTIESNSYIGIELNDVHCIGVYYNKIMRHKSSPGIYLQSSENVSIWRNDVTIFDNSESGSVADEVVSHEPSVSGVVILDSTKEWADVKKDSPACVVKPYQGISEEIDTSIAETSQQSNTPPPRTCSTRSCLLEDRSGTVTRNIKKYEFKRKGATSAQYSSSSRSQESSTPPSTAGPAAPPTGRNAATTSASKTTTSVAIDKKPISSAQKLADKMVSKAKAMVKKFSPKKKV